MASLQLLLLNLIYDISCTAIPLDNVDEDYLKKPRNWDAGSISKFMLWLGPTSSVFDILTYLLMYFIICPMFTGGTIFPQLTDSHMIDLYESVFQTGWFIEKIWSQTLVIHLIRTEKIPFIQSRASSTVTLISLIGLAAATMIPLSPLAGSFGMTAMPVVYYGWLVAILVGYMLLVIGVKTLYIRKNGELL